METALRQAFRRSLAIDPEASSRKTMSFETTGSGFSARLETTTRKYLRPGSAGSVHAPSASETFSWNARPCAVVSSRSARTASRFASTTFSSTSIEVGAGGVGFFSAARRSAAFAARSSARACSAAESSRAAVGFFTSPKGSEKAETLRASGRATGSGTGAASAAASAAAEREAERTTPFPPPASAASFGADMRS